MNLLTSAARTASGNQALTGKIGQAVAAIFLLTVSAAATDTGDTLDVYIQHSVDGGTTWDDFVHFTQVLGDGGAKKFQAFWNGLMAPEAEQAAPADATMAAGVKQGPVGSKWRVKWVIVDAGTDDASFTFKVDGDVVRS
jgi:hypothetical protein